MTSPKKSKSNCRPRFRIRTGKEIALGPGKVDLLEAIDRAGSISGAARDLGLSYRRAWDLVDTMNRCFRQPLVKRSQGGKGGGGTRLTELGRRTIADYRAWKRKRRKRPPLNGNASANPSNNPLSKKIAPPPGVMAL